MEERLPLSDLALGLVILDPLLFLLQFWGKDITQDDGTQDLSVEQRLMLCDQSERVLLCTGRKVGKTLSIERDFIQAGLTNDSTALREGMFFTPAEAHIKPVRDRIISRIVRTPLFYEMVATNQYGRKMLSANDGVEFKTNWKWYFRIEGTSGTDVNMVGLRCYRIIGDELAFGNDVCHKSRINTAMPGCIWKYCGVPNGVRGTPFWRLDQTAEGLGWSRHKVPQFANPLYSSEYTKRQLMVDHGGEHSHSYITQVLGQWGDEVLSSFPPGTIATHTLPYFRYNWSTTTFAQEHRNTIDAIRKRLEYTRKRVVIGWDYGFSPDPAAIAFFVEDEPSRWHLRIMFILRRVQFSHQVKFLNAISEAFNVAMLVTDEATGVSSLADLPGWEMWSEETLKGNAMWANIGGKIDIIDAEGDVVTDEAGNPMREYRKKWATDELRRAMVHAIDDDPYPYYLYLPDENADPDLINELIGTTETRMHSGHIRYMTAKMTEGSKSPDDHRTDALRFAIIGIRAVTTSDKGPKKQRRRISIESLGWVGKSNGWRAPWSRS